jgi:hypothetical protein
MRACDEMQELIVHAFSNKWLFSRHLALIMQVFTLGSTMRTDFGSYRTVVIAELFSKIIDVHNFELVIMQLSPEEHACVQARIGLLNIFNPWKPEGIWKLDLSRHEERYVAKMLIQMSIQEPGDHTVNSYFASRPGGDEFPGWVVNENWLSEDKFAHVGWLTITYTTGNGETESYKALRPMRAAMLALVLACHTYIPYARERVCNMTVCEKYLEESAQITFRYRGEQTVAPDTDLYFDN